MAEKAKEEQKLLLPRKSSFLYRGSLVSNAEARSKMEVDLKVCGNESLQNAIETLRKELESRSNRAKADTTTGKLKRQLDHIAHELSSRCQNSIPLSLEHLELFVGFLRRIDDTSIPDELVDRKKSLVDLCARRITNHPLAGEPRSQDKDGNQSGYAYLKVPMGRRRQMCVALVMNLITGPFILMCIVALIWKLLRPYSPYVFAAYAAWVAYDNKSRPMPSLKRVSQKWRRNVIYRLFRDYFPIRLVRGGKAFDDARNYLFCYHPHGVQSAGAFSMGTAATGVDDLFPGLRISVQTLSLNFKFPITRENLIGLGFGNASKKCLMRALTCAPGSSAVLVTGGAKESMFSHPFTSKVVLKDRAGFVKIALRTGAALVPMWGFGENNLYENLAVNSPNLRRWQRRIQRIISFAPLLVAGRGVFSYSGGLIPHRRPITVVVGEPIFVGEAESEPSMERIAKYHKMYKEAVLELFDTYKDIYDPKAEPIQFV